MSLQIKILDQDIPLADVISYPIQQERIKYSNNLTAQKIDLTLDNSVSSNYDDRDADSLFYANWYNGELSIFDDETNLYSFFGKIKNIKIDDNKKTIIVSATNYIQDLANITCVYAETGDVTPSEHIYNLLINAGIESDKIIWSGFQDAINIQSSNSCYLSISVDEETNKKYLTVVQELCRISQCVLYSINNYLFLSQWQAWGGMLANIVGTDNVIEKSYSHNYSDNEIFNYYSIAWDNAGTLNFAVGEDSDSIVEFGKSVFAFPFELKDTLSSADYPIIVKNSTGATWIGNTAIDRFNDLKKICQFKLGMECDYLKLNDQADLTFSKLYHEPVLVTERKVDKKKQQISIQAEYLNYPEIISRDTTPPSSVQLISAIANFPVHGSVKLTWTKSIESDHLAYNIYFTNSLGSWHDCQCQSGVSPIRVVDPDIENGYCVSYIYQLEYPSVYYFHITSLDDSYNESGKSNILSVILPTVATGDITSFNISGDILSIILDISAYGTPTSQITLYDTVNYDSVTYSYAGLYQSKVYYFQISELHLTIIGDQDRIYYQIKIDDGGWSTIQNISDVIEVNNQTSFQIRYLFDPQLIDDNMQIDFDEVT